MTTLELSSKKILEPSFKKRHYPPQEEQPHSETRIPKSVTWTLADGTGIESVINDVFQVLACSNLAHETVFIPIHSGKLSDVIENIMKPVRELVGVNIAETVL